MYRFIFFTFLFFIFSCDWAQLKLKFKVHYRGPTAYQGRPNVAPSPTSLMAFLHVQRLWPLPRVAHCTAQLIPASCMPHATAPQWSLPMQRRHTNKAPSSELHPFSIGVAAAVPCSTADKKKQRHWKQGGYTVPALSHDLIPRSSKKTPSGISIKNSIARTMLRPGSTPSSKPCSTASSRSSGFKLSRYLRC